MMTASSIRRVLAPLLCLVVLSGCGSKPREAVLNNMYSGDHGVLREELASHVEAQYKEVSASSIKQTGERNFVLDYMRLGLATLADGYAPESGSSWDTVYAALRQQALNEGNEVPAFLLSEAAATIWKGEPFEQALAFHYAGVHYALQGSWDNARSAWIGSQFQLKALAPDATVSPDQIVSAEGTELAAPTTIDTDFALGYLMQGIAADALARKGDLNRRDESVESFDKAVGINPGLGELVSTLKEGSYNTVFVVDFGRGPEKYGTGRHNSVPAWRNWLASDSYGLQVAVGPNSRMVPQVADVNNMASRHVWNNLEDMTRAKAVLADALIAGGAVAMGAGAYSGGNSGNAAVWVGAISMLAGLAAAATAAADVRYCEAVPQRVYVAPVAITAPDTRVSLSVSNHPDGTMSFELDPPTDGGVRLCYVRLTSDGGANAVDGAPSWATSGAVLYANDFAPSAGTKKLPYILGGDCVRSPSEAALASYREAGFLSGVTLGELEEWYRSEGIVWDASDFGVLQGKHVLEGGTLLVTPNLGTAGWARLFGQKHPPYSPKSELVRAAVAKYNPAASGAVTSSN
jgi:hypothetical protein